jgi:hypothetical protein
MRRAASALLLALVGAAGCASSRPVATVDRFGLPLDRPILQRDLSTRPEAALAYPGSHRVTSIGSDQIAQSGGEEADPAYRGAIYTVAVTPTDLYAWYVRWLSARDYHPVTYYRLTDQLSGIAWQVSGGREQIQVAIYNPKLLATDPHLPATVPRGALVYEELLVAYPPPTGR